MAREGGRRILCVALSRGRAVARSTQIHGTMSSIVTFYSYKGGVGRSMAVANIAVLLARRGLKVLAVDFDLEAPGLERYFAYFEITAHGPGLLRMFMDARRRPAVDFHDFTSTVHC